MSRRRSLPRDAISRGLYDVGATALGVAVLQAALHFAAPHVFDPAPEAGGAGVVLLLSQQVYDWLRRRDESNGGPPARGGVDT